MINYPLKVSIIIPLYNKEKSIIKTVNSILSQSYQNLEVLIVDDGSTDKSNELVSKIEDDRIILLKKENKGVSSARNKGIIESTGDYIFFLDADDLLYQDSISKFISVALKYPVVPVFTSNFDANYNNHTKLFCRKKNTELLNSSFKEMWYHNIFPRMGSIFMRRDCFESLELFATNLAKYEDLDFVIRALDKFNIVYSSHSSFLYNTQNAQLSLKNTCIEKEYASLINLTFKFDYRNLILAENIAIALISRIKMKDYKTFLHLIKKNMTKLHVILFSYIFKKIFLLTVKH